MPSTTIIRATDSFFFIGRGGPISIRKGETFHKDAKRLEDCPAEAREKNFAPFSPDHDVETATAAPGERRNVRPRRPKGRPEEPDDIGGATDEVGSQAADDAETSK